MSYVDGQLGCPRGQQHVDGHCLPTPSIVFTRCVEAFRTRTVQQDRGRETSVGASGPSEVGGQFAHNRLDRERREYDGLGSEHMDAAIAECRRQEQAERDGQLARAWDDAEQARATAERARLDAVQAKAELERLQERYDRLRERSHDAPTSPDEHARTLAASLPAPPEDGDAPTETIAPEIVGDSMPEAEETGPDAEQLRTSI